MTRTFWLSFADKGKHLGVCVIDVTDEDVVATPRHPRATPESWSNPKVRWYAAAMRLAWALDCNPGGQIGIAEISPTAPIPRNRLLTREELERWGTPLPPVH